MIVLEAHSTTVRRMSARALLVCATVAVLGCAPAPRAPQSTTPQPTTPRPKAAPPAAPQPTTLSLWPGTPPNAADDKQPEHEERVDELVAGKPYTLVHDVSTPTLTVYPPAPTTTNTGAAVMVFPGGGYKVLAIDLEGTEVCDWFTAKGVTCAVLKYRVPDWGRTGATRASATSTRIHRRRCRTRSAPWASCARTRSSGAPTRTSWACSASRQAGTCRRDQHALRQAHLRASRRRGPAELPPRLRRARLSRTPAGGRRRRQARSGPRDRRRHAADIHRPGARRPGRQRQALARLLRSAERRRRARRDAPLRPRRAHVFGLRPTALPITHWPELVDKWLGTIGDG